MPPVKFVFDTNIYISAAIGGGAYAQQWLRVDGGYSIYCSVPILNELQQKLESKFGFERADTAEFIKSIQSITTVIHPKEKLVGAVTDPKDIMILECAVECRADMIITADKDLLKLKSFRGSSIVHPSFLKYMYPDIN